MDGSGLSGLISGFQQGYSFVDDIERKKKQDARLDRAEAREDRADARTEKEFSRKEKGWKKADDYDAERTALVDEYYPPIKKDAAPALPAAAAGVAPPMPDAAASPTSSSAATAPASMAGAPSMQTAAPMPAPVAGPAAIAQQGVPQAPSAARPDPMMNMNKSLDFAMKNAMLDVKHVKLDGPGLLALQKTVDGMKREKMDDAINLLHQGRYDEATQAFNATGDHTGFQIVSAKDGVFKAGKSDVPTKIVTVQDANGNKRTINTAETFFQRQAIDKVISQAQKDRDQDETGRHNKAEEGIQGMNAQSTRISALASAQNANTSAGSLRLQQDQFKKQSLQGQMDQIESVTGPLKPDERKALGMQLAGFKTGDKGNQEYQKFVDNVVMEGVKAGTIKPEDAVKAQNRLMQGKQVMDAEATIASDLGASVGNPEAYAAKYAKALQVAPPARLAEMGFKPPVQAGKAAKIAALSGVPTASVAPQDGVDVSKDPVLMGLQRKMSEINPNDPANANVVMAIGKAKNERIQQLQDSNGKMTRLTGIN